MFGLKNEKYKFLYKSIVSKDYYNLPTTNKTTCASVSYKIQGSDIYFGGAIDEACGMYAGTYTGTVTFSVIY